MIQLSLIKCNEGYKLVHVRNRCRIVWICEEYTCYLYGSFLFSGFNRFVHFMSTNANSWIKSTARQNIIRFGNRRAVRRRRTEAGMALTAIGEITQWGGELVVAVAEQRRYSQVKVHHRYQRQRWQICRRCQWLIHEKKPEAKNLVTLSLKDSCFLQDLPYLKATTSNVILTHLAFVNIIGNFSAGVK
jgi:hypothetical protein